MQNARNLAWAFVFLVMVLSGTVVADEPRVGPQPILLWPNGAPGAVGEESQDKPELRLYLPPQEKRNGAAVVICPGGAYAVLATDHEGQQVAQWFNSIGVVAGVVKYRLGPRYHHPAPLQDVQRAIRHLRAQAATLHVAPNRIGVMGFSAGGHLAATSATHFDNGQAENTDPLEKLSSRPDFAVLCYPVVSMADPFGHNYSRKMLLGDQPDEKLIDLLSNDKQVTKETPPTFLFHTAEDTGVPPENSIAFFAALRKAGVPGELHVYQRGPHGVGLAHGDPILFGWKDRLADWLRSSGYLAEFQRAAASGSITLDGKPLRWGSVTFIPHGENAANLPAAWALVNQGKFNFAAASGPVVGKHRLEVRNLGSVEPQPTISEVTVLADQLLVTIANDKNSFSFELTSKK